MFCVVKLYHLSPVLLRCNPKEFILGEKYQTYFLKYLKYNHWVFCTICIIIVETDFQKKSLFYPLSPSIFPHHVSKGNTDYLFNVTFVS